MKRLFLDANVLFTAAHNPEGKAAFIISLGTEGAWRVCTSAFAVEEARRNLAAKYPAAEKRLDRLLSVVSVFREQPDAPYPGGLDEKDRPIFQAAHACHASHLVTGDIAHFGALMNKPEKTLRITMLTPAQFLNLL